MRLTCCAVSNHYIITFKIKKAEKFSASKIYILPLKSWDFQPDKPGISLTVGYFYKDGATGFAINQLFELTD